MTNETTHPTKRYERRTVLKTTVAAATAATVGSVPAGASTGSTATDLTEWLSNVGNFDGVVDERGSGDVTVAVGAQGNGGGFGFGPPVVRVDPGTTVTWTWTGDGGDHNVVADDASFESDFFGTDGATFTQTFTDAGVTKYYCTPHKVMGMKGVIVVGDVDVTTPDPATSAGESESDDDAGATESPEGPGFDGWFENVSNYDGVYDYTGQSTVEVEVGVAGNNGAFAFGPAAVRVDPGTTVTWTWTGDGGDHNVVANDASFESDLLGTEGASFEHTFDVEGTKKYYCGPHEAMGMKGAVVVGGSGGKDPAGAAGDGAGDGGGSDGGDGVGDELWLVGLAGGLVALLLSPFVVSAASTSKTDAQKEAYPRR